MKVFLNYGSLLRTPKNQLSAAAKWMSALLLVACCTTSLPSDDKKESQPASKLTPIFFDTASTQEVGHQHASAAHYFRVAATTLRLISHDQERYASQLSTHGQVLATKHHYIAKTRGILLVPARDTLEFMYRSALQDYAKLTPAALYEQLRKYEPTNAFSSVDDAS